MSTRTRTTLSLVLALLLVGLVAMPAAAKRKDFVGIASEDTLGGSATYRARAFAAQRASGVQLIRINFQWAAIERSPNRYSFVEYDRYVGAAARAGLRLLPVLQDPPAFRSSAPAYGARRGSYPPRSYEAMGNYAAALVRRYGRFGSFWRQHPNVPFRPIRSWQVWNEPSLSVYWPGGPNPAQYVALLRAVKRSINSVDKSAEVVTAGIPYTKIRSAVPLARFLRGMYRAGGKSAFRTLAINAYSENKGELKRTLKRVRKLMRRYGDRKKKLWVTELGWATAGPHHRLNVGMARQGSRIRSSFRWIKKNRKRYKLRGLVYFQWRDQKPYPPTFKDMWGLHTGLVDGNSHPKPALQAFAKAARRLR